MPFGDVAPGGGRAAGLLLLAGVVLIEALWLVVVRKRGYDWKAAGASFGVAVGRRLIGGATAGIAAAALLWVYQHRLFTIEVTSIGPFVLLFVLFELVYYWHHRLAHEVRWLWATHCVHHTPAEMNLSVAARLGWTGLLSGSFLFFAPLVWIGFHPLALFLVMSASLFYQIWLHTEVIGKLPRPVEWLFNTPSHHRVHHAANPAYLDRNYGGVLILWDRLFGTFAEEAERPRYGLTEPLTSYNPVKIALREWGRMLRDLRRAKTVPDALNTLFAPPGWSPTNRRRATALVIRNPFRTSPNGESR